MEGNRTNENNNEVRDINILLFSERSHEKVFFVNTLVNCSANRSPREDKRKRPLYYMVSCEFNVTDKHDGNHKITINSNVDDYHKIHRLKIWASNEKCHDMCFLSNIPEEFVGWSEHKFCKCISEATDTCSVCHRPRSDHMHRYYLTYKHNESRILRNVTEYLTDIPEKLGAVFEGFRAIMKERQDSLEEDKETLSKCVTKFVRFLEKHSDNPFNDVYKNYMNLMISRESQLEKNADPLIIQEWKKVLSEYLALHDVYLSFHKDGSFLQDEISKLSRSNNFGNILIQMYRCQTVPRTNEFIATHSGHTYFDLKRVDTGIKDMTNRELNDNNKENLESWKLAEQIGSYNIISSNDAQGSILENSVDTVSDIRNKLEATTLSDSNTDLSSIDSYSQNNDATSLDVYSQQSGGRDPRNPRNRSSCDNPSTPGRNSSIFAQSTLQHNKCTSNPSVLNTTSYLNKRFLTEYRHSNDNRLYNNGPTFPSSLPNSSLDSDYSTHDNQSSDHSNSVDIYSLPVFNIHSPSNYSYTTKPPSNYAQEPLNQEENMFASDIQSNNIQNPLYQQKKFGENAQQMFSYDDTLTGYPSPHSSSRDRRRPNMEHIVFHQSHSAGENIQQSSSNRTEIFMPIHSTSPHMTQVARNELQPGPHPYDHPILIGGHHPIPFKYMEQEGLHHQPSPTGKNVQERSSNPRQYLQPVPDTQGNRPSSVVRVTNQKSRRVRKKVDKTSSTAQISDTKSNESKYQKNKKAMKGTTFDNTQSLVTKQNSLSTNVDPNTQTEYFYPKKVSDPKFYEGTPIFMQESNSRIPPQNIQSISQRTSSDNSSRSLSLVEPLYIDIQEDSFLLDAEYQNLPNALMPVVHNIHQINKKLPVKL